MKPPPLRTALVIVLALAALCSFAPAAPAQSPGDGPGGPILVVANDGENRFGRYYAELLRAEGLNEFAVEGVGALNAQTLAGYQVVLLAETTLSAGQASVLGAWVNGGGNLIAMRPDPDLAALLGIAGTGATLSDAYLKVDGSRAPGAGIVTDTIQFHGTADRYALNGATSVATLFSDATTATSAPAVTLRNVGAAGGQAAAFTYDLARSVVYTRQGNPAWAGNERDGTARSAPTTCSSAAAQSTGSTWARCDPAGRRAAAAARESDHADEPRPDAAAAVLVPAARREGGGRHDRRRSRHRRHQRAVRPLQERRAQPAARSPPGSCIRSTSYVYPVTTIPTRRGYQAGGFEIALHLNTDCAISRRRRSAMWTEQWPRFRTDSRHWTRRTNRTHCIVWSDWASEPIVARENGVRLDTNYYYWPDALVQDRPGMFTGSGFPMRFADTDGSLIDVYQATTQITDEWGTTPRLHTAHRGAARRRPRPAGLLRRLHRQYAHRCGERAPPGRGRHRRRSEGARRPGGLRGADARLARRPQRVVLPRRRLQRRAAALQHRARRRRERARGHGPRRRGDGCADRADARRRSGRRDHPHGQGHRLRGLPGRRRRVRGHIREQRATPFPAVPLRRRRPRPAPPATASGRPDEVRCARQGHAPQGSRLRSRDRAAPGALPAQPGTMPGRRAATPRRAADRAEVRHARGR